MNRSMTFALTTLVLVYMASSVAMAQNAPPTFQGDPDVYKVLFEDQNFRVILGTWKAGATDKPHSHPVPSVVYSVTDCKLRLHSADGKTTDIQPKAGTATAVPITPSHSAENISDKDCQALFVERK
jgi:quercetin dioxygenase-like cupin family protein